MESRISSTEWPSVVVPRAVQRLLDHFFSLMDTMTDEAGSKLTTDIFTSDATFISSSGTFKGSLEIKQSRAKAWEHVTSRYHEIVKVYSATEDGSDLLMIGNAVLVLKNGKKVQGDFLGRARIERINTPDPRMSFFQAWGDTGPMIKAMQES
ncbi:hypothetical protein BGW36DRAFT_423830 [Talaromyces proteolyticus]|uniref:SnoaL-like domain-containing protein n=1 Tax=Talaromyces proteolyticus TaxID=1131652 RepID=A0AAD4KUM0_9EURO|nr:uncharacterized protein BGW36DRAFT_423830 [Talaromyces proteolyticus]KAH8701517.1 hypothetical protein BGW36DRAFT_423830 [Talaromyces proteolyticus]